MLVFTLDQMRSFSLTRDVISSKLVLSVVISSLLLTNSFVLYSHAQQTDQIFFGVNMKGYHTFLTLTCLADRQVPKKNMAEQAKFLTGN